MKTLKITIIIFLVMVLITALVVLSIASPLIGGLALLGVIFLIVWCGSVIQAHGVNSLEE